MNGIETRLHRPQMASFAGGLFFLMLSFIGAGTAAFFVSWLWSFVFWTGLSLGCLNAAMMHSLAGGRWGNVTRRFFEAGFMTLPLMAILFIPILFGLHQLYPWARPEQVAADPLLRQKTHYENFTGFLLRAIFFFGVWILIATKLRRWSLQQDTTADVAPTVKMRTLSGPGIVVVPLTVTFAMVDWVMSIEPAWFSTVFGVILLAGQVLVALAFAILLLFWLNGGEPGVSHFEKCDHQKAFHDLGNLLFAFVMFWTYVAFSQVLIIYAGNQPHEIGWYLRRIFGNWKWIAGMVAAFHFLVPFSLLLFRAVSENIRALGLIAALLFLVHALEIFWVMAPTFYRGGIAIHWTDFAVWLGMGGLWLGIFFRNLKRHPLIAQNHPQMETATPKTAHV
jgi:hypothetical protein